MTVCLETGRVASGRKGLQPRLQAVLEGLQQRANEGQILPPSAWA
jgi:hypothetical protein